MDIKDISVVPTSDYQRADALIREDTDHNDVTAVLHGTTVTNQTDKVIVIKSTNKGTPSGLGKALDVGQSFFYPVFDSRRIYIKTFSGSVGAGSVIISGEQQ